jgi:hypothetical protein
MIATLVATHQAMVKQCAWSTKRLTELDVSRLVIAASGSATGRSASGFAEVRVGRHCRFCDRALACTIIDAASVTSSMYGETSVMPVSVKEAIMQ